MTTTPPPSRPARSAWRIGGSMFAAVTLALLGWEAADQLAARNETRISTADTTGLDRVVIDADDASVLVTGRSGISEVVIDAEVRLSLSDAELTVVRRGAELHIDAPCGPFSDSCVRRLDVTIPPGLDVVATSDDGALDVRGTRGAVDLNSANGRIALDGVSGRLDLRSGNGDVLVRRAASDAADLATDNGTIRVDFDSAPLRVSANTDNGDVVITLPSSADRDGTDFAVAARSDNGEVSTPIRTNPSSRRIIQASSDNGDVSVAYRP